MELNKNAIVKDILIKQKEDEPGIIISALLDNSTNYIEFIIFRDHCPRYYDLSKYIGRPYQKLYNDFYGSDVEELKRRMEYIRNLNTISEKINGENMIFYDDSNIEVECTYALASKVFSKITNLDDDDTIIDLENSGFLFNTITDSDTGNILYYLKDDLNNTNLLFGIDYKDEKENIDWR